MMDVGPNFDVESTLAPQVTSADGTTNGAAVAINRTNRSASGGGFIFHRGAWSTDGTFTFQFQEQLESGGAWTDIDPGAMRVYAAGVLDEDLLDANGYLVVSDDTPPTDVVIDYGGLAYALRAVLVAASITSGSLPHAVQVYRSHQRSTGRTAMDVDSAGAPVQF